MGRKVAGRGGAGLPKPHRSETAPPDPWPWPWPAELGDAVLLYNYGVSQHVNGGRTCPQSFLEEMPTVLVTVRGGGYGPPRKGWDHSTPYLQRVLADLWEADLTVVGRELTLVGVDQPRTDLAVQRHAEARDAVRRTGRALAAK
ncbi:hypothetical protein [Actinomadura miaoliensis]|uniref:Flavodoxin-like fold domain-containing protein n=1 Tax=Actinomadura miaoliensis TaxID=430685 RepID=A0ABP7UYS6_9ACTN